MAAVWDAKVSQNPSGNVVDLSMKVLDFHTQLTHTLSPLYGSDEARVIGHLMLEHLTGKSWQRLTLDREATLSSESLELARSFTNRLLSAEPIQYVLGEAHFYGREFHVNPSVLIPRPETEELIYWILEEISHLPNPSAPIQGLDIGTGTGCIPIILELELQERGIDSHWMAWDISESAIQVAQCNINRHQATTELTVQDIFQADAETASQLDLIVSNPPYIPEAEKSDLHANVREHEPGLALFVPDHDPLLFYKCIITLGEFWLASGGAMYLEVHADYAKEVQELFIPQSWNKAEIRIDLRGKARMVRAFRQ